MREEIIGQQFDQERALYHLCNADVIDCDFAGPADGESALKEGRDVTLRNCRFSLRYPLWHTQGFRLRDSKMDDKTRAAIWYAKDGEISGSDLGGIKALRECQNITLRNCRIDSQEFGWKCRNVTLHNCALHSEYVFFDSKDIRLEDVEMSGKYSFQYMENLVITNSVLNTKDAFWHSKNVTVRNSVIKGEYLAWFSEGLTLQNCRIIGTQPLCYCKDLTLIDCTMENTDLAFEYSDVQASIRGHVQSIKNPRSGVITLDSVGEVIWGDAVMDCSGKVVCREG